ncbi:MAG: hypothetical protein AUK31_09300 [Fibrobacteres bacterium CG2_30_45_31]|nr:MAG: hypothetical protein AUK31_09300 [Fibrobacteres bacterium CG2_30_45_31]
MQGRIFLLAIVAVDVPGPVFKRSNRIWNTPRKKKSSGEKQHISWKIPHYSLEIVFFFEKNGRLLFHKDWD